MIAEIADVELAEMMGLGSGPALDELFLRHAAAVRRIGVAILHNPDAADELVQETFLQAWRHRARYSSERASVKTWIFAIARNQAIDAVRAQARHTRLVEAARALRRIAPRPTCPLDETISRDEMARVRAALALLPRVQRRALVLAYWGGLSHAEVAQRTGVPLGTVKSRIRLGGQSIARRLEPWRRSPGVA